MNPQFEKVSAKLFSQYNNNIKPLIAEIEARGEVCRSPYSTKFAHLQII